MRTTRSAAHPLVYPLVCPLVHPLAHRLIAIALPLVLLLSACSKDDSADDAIDDALSAQADEEVQVPTPGDADDGRQSGTRPADALDEATEDEATDEAAASAEAPAAGSATAGRPAPLTPGPLSIAPDEPLPPPGPAFPPPEFDGPVDPREDAESTFGLDVDTGSYSLVRATLEDGGTPDPVLVRPEEFINAFDYDYAVDGEETFAVTAGLAPWAYGSDGQATLLQIGLATPVEEDRGPASLVFVVDTSGSMEQLLPLVQGSLRILVDELQPGDAVSIVTYSDDAAPILPPTDASDRDAILDGIDRLEIGGSTNLEAGLDLGYATARRLAEDGRTTRVILASDGIANVGNTTPEAILDTVGQGLIDGVEMVTVGFGLQGFNDPLMEQLANQGDGFFAYVDTLDQAETLFSGGLLATAGTIARDARAQVVFDPDTVASYRLIGYVNRDIADDDFRDDSVDAGELVAGHTVTALYALDLHDEASGDVATVQLRWLDPEDDDAREIAVDVGTDAASTSWVAADEGLRLAGTVAAWAETLAGNPQVDASSADLLADLRLLADAYPTEVDELSRLVALSDI